MASHFKIHELLSASELEELRAFAREPGRTIDEIHRWLLERGYTLSRSAVGNWKQAFDQEVMAERFSRSSELAAAIKGAVQNGEFSNVADAAVMQLTQVIFEQAVKLDSEGTVKSGDLLNMAIALRQAVGSKQQILKLAAEKFDAEMARATAVTKDGKIAPQDIAEARKRIFGF